MFFTANIPMDAPVELLCALAVLTVNVVGCLGDGSGM